jgi:hypothetical protein
MGVLVRLLLAALALLVLLPDAATAAVAQGWDLAASSTRSMIVLELPCEYDMPSSTSAAGSRTMPGVDADAHRSEHLAADFAQIQAARAIPSLSDDIARTFENPGPGGPTIYEGFAAAQGGLVGGGSQVVIPSVNPAWIVP